MPFIPGTNIKVVGGKFNDIKGDLTVFDYSRHETNIDSNNMYDNKVTDSYNKNPKIINACSTHGNHEDDEMDQMHFTTAGDQRREDYTDPFFSSSQSQSSAGGHIHNHGRSNTTYTLIDNAFNDNSEHHFGGGPGVPPTNQQPRVRPRNPQSKSQVVPPYIQHINQRMRQTFSNSKESGQIRPSSEENGVPNMPRNTDDDDEQDEEPMPSSTSKTPLSSSSSGPIIRTFKGNVIKRDNSVHETNISSFNAERNEINNSFN